MRLVNGRCAENGMKKILDEVKLLVHSIVLIVMEKSLALTMTQ